MKQHDENAELRDLKLTVNQIAREQEVAKRELDSLRLTLSVEPGRGPGPTLQHMEGDLDRIRDLLRLLDRLSADRRKHEDRIEAIRRDRDGDRPIEGGYTKTLIDPLFGSMQEESTFETMLRTLRQASQHPDQSGFGALLGRSQEWVSRIENGKVRLTVADLGEWVAAAGYDLLPIVTKTIPEPHPPAVVARLMVEASALYGEYDGTSARERCARLAERAKRVCQADTVLLYVVDADERSWLIHDSGFRFPGVIADQPYASFVPSGNRERDCRSIWSHVEGDDQAGYQRGGDDVLHSGEDLTASLVVPLVVGQHRLGMLILGYQDDIPERLAAGAHRPGVAGDPLASACALANLGTAFLVAAGCVDELKRIGTTTHNENPVLAGAPEHDMARRTLSLVATEGARHERANADFLKTFMDRLDSALSSLSVRQPHYKLFLEVADDLDEGRGTTDAVALLFEYIGFKPQIINSQDSKVLRLRDKTPAEAIARCRDRNEALNEVDEVISVISPDRFIGLPRLIVRLRDAEGGPIERSVELVAFLQSTFDTLYAAVAGLLAIDGEALIAGTSPEPSEGVQEIGTLLNTIAFDDDRLQESRNDVKRLIKLCLKRIADRPSIRSAQPMMLAVWPYSPESREFDKDLEVSHFELAGIPNVGIQDIAARSDEEISDRLCRRRHASRNIIYNRCSMITSDAIGKDSRLYKMIGGDLNEYVGAAACVPLVSTLSDRSRGVAWFLFRERIASEQSKAVWADLARIGWFFNAILFANADRHTMLDQNEAIAHAGSDDLSFTLSR